MTPSLCRYISAVSMKLTPSATARSNTARDPSLSATRLVPSPRRLTVRSPPRVIVPAAAAWISAMRAVLPLSRSRGRSDYRGKYIAGRVRLCHCAVLACERARRVQPLARRRRPGRGERVAAELVVSGLYGGQRPLPADRRRPTTLVAGYADPAAAAGPLPPHEYLICGGLAPAVAGASPSSSVSAARLTGRGRSRTGRCMPDRGPG